MIVKRRFLVFAVGSILNGHHALEANKLEAYEK